MWDNAIMVVTNRIQALAIGHAARNVLHEETQAYTCGNTSKGIFALTDNKRILFITHLPYNGPLTINTERKIRGIDHIAQNTRLIFSDKTILFAQSALEITVTRNTSVWKPTPLTTSDFNRDEFSERVKEMDQRLSNFLANRESTDLNIIRNRLLNITPYSLVSALEIFPEILGYGKGLTPSGDDFICGFTLALHAWKDILFPGEDVQPLVDRIVQQAFGKTTSISANLISFAAEGSADERILNSIQWLHIGSGACENIMKELLTYGSSSGIDTLAGILACIQVSPVF